MNSKSDSWLQNAAKIIEKNRLETGMIVAQTADGIIGTGAKIPWHIPEDLKFFKKTTMDSNLIMGSRTWKSIGRALPNRKNIVLSRKKPPSDLGDILVVNSPLEAIAACEPEKKVFIIGGAQIYKIFEPLTNKAFITIVKLHIIDAQIKYNALEFVKEQNWHCIDDFSLSQIAHTFVYSK